ncbi:WSCD family member GA21586-like [Argiope bruennichi]|uniref:WSCD family member GA21586 like protein n=1 Tax=Argiope bruennichi TaxID=94029 RepID=A0A8T0E5S9_ARGBR|nr:WSCD family member GA21586-like [Argiope bruennichi]KAF8766844.1 WSCD family member GA21586 like protein [Argiope bruennichi]
MEIKRRVTDKRHPLSSTSKHFRRVLYGLIGVVLSSYVVLFILVVSRHIDQSAQNEVRRALTEEAKQKPKNLKPVSLVGGIGHSLLRMERYQERWAAMAKALNTNEGRLPHIRRRINVCAQPKFRNPPGPMIALASFPGSGNTWIRFLVQQATGILTGSVYRDYSLKRNGFPAESVANGSVLLIKTHEWGETTRQKFQKAVLLIRDPFGCLVAEFNRRAGGHVGHASPEKFHRGNAWPNFVATHSKLWMESILDWLQFEGPLLVIRYETITQELPGQLIRLLKFLDANVTWNAFQCILRNRDGIFRRAKKQLNFELFDESMKRTIEGYKAIIETALRYHEQGVKFDIHNTTLLQSSANNGSNFEVMPMTYIEKAQIENGS